MDPVLRDAARALSAFDPLAALKLVALREEPAALALRGIAMAQLGDYATARKLLRRASRAAGVPPVARARALAAEAEVALACRDLTAAREGLEAAARLLDAAADRDNALFVRIQLARQLAFVGELAAARRKLTALDLRGAPARIVAAAALVGAEIAVRRVRAGEANLLLRRAHAAARFAQVPFLVAEVERAVLELRAPLARVRVAGEDATATLEDIEVLRQSADLVVDARGREVRRGDSVVSLTTRPVLFALVRVLAGAAPNEVPRDTLIERAFAATRTNESLRARLRVEIGRLRAELKGFATVRATAQGYLLVPLRDARVHVLSPLDEGEGGAILALLSDGEAWSTSALATALGKSQRGVQRALGALQRSGSVQATGRGRTQRWSAPSKTGFATTLLLVEPEPRV